MIVKEYWDNGKLNGIFWLGDKISILAHEAGFLKLKTTGESYYGEDLREASEILGVNVKDLKEASKLLDVPIEDLRDIRRRIEDENRS